MTSSALALSTLLLAASNPVPSAPLGTSLRSVVTQEGSATELERRLERLSTRLEQARLEDHIAGMAIAVVKDDEIVLAHGFGMADLENETAVTPETVFAVGSTTKAFTTAVLGMLMDDGAIDWDSPVVEYLPYFELAVDGGEPEDVTIRDLISHRTGFTRMGVLWGAGRASRDTVLRTATRAEAWSPFRKAFFYNNVMYLAAGEAAAVAGGASWEVLVRTRILEPLGMEDSNLSVAATREDARTSRGYRWNEATGENEVQPMRDLDTIAPAGSINSNVLDMAQWIRLQLGRGEFEGERLISRQRLEDTWTPTIKIGPGISYGLGWMIHDWNGRRVVQHGGNIDGFSAMVALLPDDGIGFVLLMNASVTTLQNGSRDIVWSSLLSQEPSEPASEEPTPETTETTGGDAGVREDFAPFVGAYETTEGPLAGQRFEVLVKDGTLAVDIPGQTTYELLAPDADGKRPFALAPDTIQVEFEREEDAVVLLKLHQAGMTFELHRVDETLDDLPTLDVLDELTGALARTKAFDELGIIRMRGSLRYVHSGIEGTVEMTFTSDAGGGKWVQESTFEPFGWSAGGFDGAVGWDASAFAPSEELDGKFLAQRRLGHPFVQALDWRRYFDGAKVVREIDDDEWHVFVVELTADGLPKRTRYIDAESGEVLRSEAVAIFPSTEMPTKSVFEDYREVDGVRIPFRVVNENVATGRTVIQFETFETNVDLTDDVFGAR